MEKNKISAEKNSEEENELKQAIEEAEELGKRQKRKTFDSFDEALREMNKED